LRLNSSFCKLNTLRCPTGSSHSDKELDIAVFEKGGKLSEKRKRKRKADDSNTDKVINGKQSIRAPSESKKINDYFVKHSGSSPVRHVAKPSSPAHQTPLSIVSNKVHRRR